MTEPEQAVLFELPPSKPTRVTRAAQPGNVTYTKWKPARRKLCDDCIRDIHERGIAVAPYPSGVRWRRVCDGVSVLLCPRHKDLRVQADG